MPHFMDFWILREEFSDVIGVWILPLCVYYYSKLNFDRGFYGYGDIFAARLELGLRIAYSLSIIALSFH